MKGLVLTHLGRREEGLELVKKGMRYDLTSHICWHVFGLIQKGEKNYEEALKSYTQALRFDKVRSLILPLLMITNVLGRKTSTYYKTLPTSRRTYVCMMPYGTPGRQC